MLQLLQRFLNAWRKSDPSAVEAMSAMMALSFLIIFSFGGTFVGVVQPDQPALLRLCWGVLAFGASIPALIGWYLSHDGLRRNSLLCGVAFWVLITASLASKGDPRWIAWVVTTGFVTWSYLRRGGGYD